MSKGRQYPEYVREQYDKMPCDAWGAVTVGAFSKCDPPQHGDCWGSWRYNAKTLELEYRPADQHYSYEVYLDKCDTSAGMLDWIIQVSNKDVSHQDVGDLVQALQDLLNPQGTLCSFGAEKGPINVAALLKQKKGAP